MSPQTPEEADGDAPTGLPEESTEEAPLGTTEESPEGEGDTQRGEDAMPGIPTEGEPPNAG
jgi:hypothetical protein